MLYDVTALSHCSQLIMTHNSTLSQLRVFYDDRVIVIVKYVFCVCAWRELKLLLSISWAETTMLHSCRRRYRRRLQAPRRSRRRLGSSLLALVRSKGTTAGTYCMRPSLVVHRRVGRYHHGQRIKPLCLCYAAAASRRLASPRRASLYLAAAALPRRRTQEHRGQ